MKYILTILISIILLPTSAQTNNDSLTKVNQEKETLKKVMAENKFVSSKLKKKVPLEVLKKLDINSKDEIAGRNERWESGCCRTGKHPYIKLNWVAEANQSIWVVSLSYGGYCSSTVNYIINNNEVKELRYGNQEITFKEFRQWCLNGQPREKF